MRLAMHFAHAKGSKAAAASVALAEEVLRTMVFAKVKLAGIALLGVTVLASAAATWSRRETAMSQSLSSRSRRMFPGRTPGPSRLGRRLRRRSSGQPGPFTESSATNRANHSPKPGSVETLHIGRTAGKSSILRIVCGNARNRIAMNTGRSFRQAGSASTSSFETKRERAIHPDHIRCRQDMQSPDSPFDVNLREPANAAVTAKGGPAFLVRASEGFWEMESLEFGDGVAARTGPNGRFSVEATFVGMSTRIQFASPDFSRGQIYSILDDDPDRPLEIVLKPLARRALA